MPVMSIRSIFAMMIAFAMLFAPLAMPAAAMAMASPDQHMMTMADDHCADQADGKNGKDSAKSCCVAMCAAVAVAPAALAKAELFDRVADLPSLVRFTHGFLAELATPPPRFS